MKTLKYFCSNSARTYSNSARIGILLPWLLAWHHPAMSHELIKNLNINPFLSQAAVYTSDNHFYGDSDGGVSWRSNEIGAVLNYNESDYLK